ncbi:GDSL-type esterase/lipase family protein [Streptomyces sp. V4-01]|uniref:GDSL-type esterase/lipase family protein n=1 Tax=Actinacidiphila polyblastidii TaxID=3110430 RepID=A0ABU7PJG9_9ACTN|nr:GDSL-type esterase/lipase family protein [Streptomyces sp. V4-01]
MNEPGAAPAGLRFAVLGDSLSEGVGDPLPGGGWRGWAALLGATLGDDVLIVNAAWSGARSADVAGPQLAVALRHRPHLASVLVGGNDTLRGGFDIAAVAAELHAAMGALRTAGAELLTACLPDPGAVLGLPWPLARPLGRRMRALNDVGHALSAHHGALHVHVAQHAWTADPGTLSADRLHPSETGHRLLARDFHAALSAAGLARGPAPRLTPDGRPPGRASSVWWMATRGTRWIAERCTDLLPDLLRLAAEEYRAAARGATPLLDHAAAEAAAAALAALGLTPAGAPLPAPSAAPAPDRPAGPAAFEPAAPAAAPPPPARDAPVRPAPGRPAGPAVFEAAAAAGPVPAPGAAVRPAPGRPAGPAVFEAAAAAPVPGPSAAPAPGRSAGRAVSAVVTPAPGGPAGPAVFEAAAAAAPVPAPGAAVRPAPGRPAGPAVCAPAAPVPGASAAPAPGGSAGRAVSAVVTPAPGRSAGPAVFEPSAAAPVPGASAAPAPGGSAGRAVSAVAAPAPGGVRSCGSGGARARTPRSRRVSGNGNGNGNGSAHAGGAQRDEADSGARG